MKAKRLSRFIQGVHVLGSIYGAVLVVDKIVGDVTEEVLRDVVAVAGDAGCTRVEVDKDLAVVAHGELGAAKYSRRKRDGAWTKTVPRKRP